MSEPAGNRVKNFYTHLFAANPIRIRSIGVALDVGTGLIET
jgi:hypothetical protein